MIERVFVVLVALTVGTAFARGDDKIDFQKQIQPIFLEHCAKCHGEAKVQGKMRLHTAAAVQEKLQADPELLVAGKPEESELFERLTLRADSPKRMPKEADPLPKEKIELIAQWIREGAVLTTAAAVAEPAAQTTAEEKPAEKPALPEVATAPQAAIDRLAAAGARVTPLFAGSNLLDVSFAGRSEPAGDAEIALLADVGEQVYTLNLADAKVTADGLAPLATQKNLAALHLERSEVTDDGLVHVGGLAQLQYLNLYGTSITDAGLKHLAGLKQLTRLYLWQTKVSYDAAMSLEKDIPGLIVNLGFDHPVVARMRLTKELEAAKAQVEEAKAEAEKVKQRLEQAQKEVETTAARVAEVEQQLKALDAPADGSRIEAGAEP